MNNDDVENILINITKIIGKYLIYQTVINHFDLFQEKCFKKKKFKNLFV